MWKKQKIKTLFLIFWIWEKLWGVKFNNTKNVIYGIVLIQPTYSYSPEDGRSSEKQVEWQENDWQNNGCIWMVVNIDIIYLSCCA
jgi:hypothetical protein